MSEEVLQQLVGAVPQLTLMVFFIVALVLVLKEYARLRAEIRRTTEEVVSGHLGKLVADIQSESNKATKLREAISEEAKHAKAIYSELEVAYAERQTHLAQANVEIEQRIQFLKEILPDATMGTAKPASWLVSEAQHVDSWVEAFALLAKVRDDADATSRDLEIAGDRARNFSQFTVALDFYDKSQKRDAANRSAALEYHCLRAEIDYEERDKSLESAKQIVFSSRKPEFMNRLANAYIQLDRSDELRRVCEELLSDPKYQSNKDMMRVAHRNLAVVLQEMDDFAGAEEHLRQALLLAANDENTLRALFSVLKDQDRFDDAFQVAVQLVQLDPLDGDYFYSVAECLARLGRHAEAAEWFRDAEMQLPQGHKKYLAGKEFRKSTLRPQLSERLGQLQMGDGDLRVRISPATMQDQDA